jgi:signal transduction histidine kinase
METVGETTLEPTASGAAEAREHAMHGLALACAAGGMVHQVRNPLNAMALQLALLAEKLGGFPEVMEACAGNLGKLQDQIGRIDEAVRRYADAAEPAGGGAFDAGRLAAEAAALFAHEARRRHGSLEARVAASGLRARGDAARVARLWLGLVWRALEEAGEAGAVRLSAAAEGGEVALGLAYARAAPERAPAWMGEAAAAAARDLGGRLDETEAAGTARIWLRFPAEAR